jgi:hypothetical protein
VTTIVDETLPAVSDRLDFRISRNAASVKSLRDRLEPWVAENGSSGGRQPAEAMQAQVLAWLQAEIVVMSEEQKSKAQRVRERKSEPGSALLI